MARSTRQIPKAIAEFGEKQFQDLRPDCVDVLKVKAATIRKYWSKLRGIAYLVAVISTDRVRVYFFNSKAVMLIGENIDHQMYEKVRKKSKLIRKFEQPKPPTELELRMEATEELRSTLAKSIRRVARFLGQKEPDFPDIYVSKELDLQSSQSYGLLIEDDGSYIFHESLTNPSTIDPIAIRAAFLAHLETTKAQSEISQCFSNAVTAMLLKDKAEENWIDWWIKSSKETNFMGMVKHLLEHKISYNSSGMTRILELLQQAPMDAQFDEWLAALKILHRHHEVNLGTEAWHIISGFCKNLRKPRNLLKSKYQFDEIHLGPRVISNPVPLGIDLKMQMSEQCESIAKSWLQISLLEGSSPKTFCINQEAGESIDAIHYFLKFEDIFPKSGGLTSLGRDVLSWALEKLNVSTKSEYLIESCIQLEDASISESEKAVLERLVLGDLTILSNTLLGSPGRVESLMNSGCIMLLPFFQHIGIHPNFLIEGSFETLKESIISSVLEATVFVAPSRAYAIVAAPSPWEKELLLKSKMLKLNLWPVIDVYSPRNILRMEKDPLVS